MTPTQANTPSPCMPPLTPCEGHPPPPTHTHLGHTNPLL